VVDAQPLLEPVARPRTYELILAQIEGLLLTGRLRPGARLPPERAIAEQLGVSRASVREALKVLEALGVVMVSGGQGRESGAVVVARPGPAMATAMRLHVATGGLPVADLVATRVILESATVRSLAGSDPDRLDPARALLDAMDAPGLEAPEFLRLDASFHVALADAAGNRAVAVVMSSLRGAIEGYVATLAPPQEQWAGAAAVLRAEHRAILDAIDSGQVERAVGAVERHVVGYVERGSS
jgi:GntR family transcriptional regulator, transcriptional repressor for pyruvate dehydrogenase complex